MPCTHVLLRGACGCPPDPAPTPALVAETPASCAPEGEYTDDLLGREEPASDELDDPNLLDEDFLVALRADLLRHDFAAYCREAWATINPATRLEWSWHHTLICEVLQALFELWLRSQRDPEFLSPIVNALINVCPGSTKSTIASICFPTWVWLRAPSARFTCISVNEDVSLRDARAAREVIRSRWYQETFAPEWTLKGDQDAISNYGNTEGGVRLSKPAGSHIVGLRGDFLMVDDYDDPNDVENKGKREAALALWDRTIYSRVNDYERSIRIGLQQRVHASDWSGHVLAKQGEWSPENRFGWLRVAIPAEHKPALAFRMPDVLRAALGVAPGARPPELVLDDPRREAGEVLHPVRFSKEFLASERKRWEGTGNYSAQYNQEPISQEGAQVKREWWSFARLERGVREAFDAMATARQHPRPTGCRRADAHAPYLVQQQHYGPGRWNFDWVALSVDCAAKKTEKGSNWGMICGAGEGGRRFVLDDRTRRGDILEIIETLKEMVRLWHPDAILVEDKAAGPDLILRLRAEMAKGDLPPVEIVVINPGSQGKEQRLMACVPIIASGVVHLLDGAEWVEAFVDELAAFPNGVQSDRVDALSQLLSHYAEDAAFDLPDWS